MQRHRHLLGGEEVVAHRHRERQVDHQHGGRPGGELGLLDLEVVRRQAHRRAAALAGDRVADRALDVEVERVAELVGLRVHRPLVAEPGPGELVLAELVAGQLGEEVVERVLADAAEPGRGQLVAALPVLDEPGLLEHLGQLGHLLEAVGRFVADELPGPVEVDLGQRTGVGGAAHQLLELVEVAELVHDLGGVGEPERVLALEVVAAVPAHVRERLLQVGGQLVHLPAAGPCPRAAARTGPGAAPAAPASSS